MTKLVADFEREIEALIDKIGECDCPLGEECAECEAAMAKMDELDGELKALLGYDPY